MSLLSLLIGALAPGLALPPVPPPPTISCDPFLIFFAVGSASIPDDQQSMINNIVSAANQSPQRLVVGGYADRSGSDAYNFRLAHLRAEGVKETLVARGLRTSRITVKSFGESRPVVVTEDGLAEQQNRFVSVCFL